MKASERWKWVGSQWSILSYYQRFESLAAFVLTIIISLIIVVALYRLASSVVLGLVFGLLDPLEPKAFQTVFGEIMTLLIALEFNHTLQYAVSRQESIIQTRVVILIALLALARKIIILDIHEFSTGEMLGMAAMMLALGITYGIMQYSAAVAADRLEES